MDLFNDLQFIEDTHTYILDGKIIPSMSYKISLLHEKFNTDLIAPLSAKKHKLKESTLRYQWENAKLDGLDIGNNAHSYAEIGGNKYTLYRESINQYLLDIPNNIEIVAKELRMYSRKYWVAGTCDLLLYDNTTNSYIIVDYKTNKNLFKSYNKDLFFPFEYLLDTAYNKYIVQLNGYQLMLEEAGIKISNRVLIWVSKRSTHSLYQQFMLPNVVDKIKIHFENTKTC